MNLNTRFSKEDIQMGIGIIIREMQTKATRR